MRILVLTQIVPYPPDSGPKVKTWNVLRHMAASGHQIILASFVRAEEEPHLASLNQVCEQVHGVAMRRSRIADVYYLLRSQLTRRPFLIERDDLRQMRRIVDRIVQDEAVDCVYADQLTMTQFGSGFLGTKLQARRALSGERKRPMLIYDSHNADWMTVERMVEAVPWVFRPLIRLEARRVKRYIAGIVQDFDHTFAVTEVDRQLMLGAVAERSNGLKRDVSQKITVFPITVDTSRLQPVRRQNSGFDILTLGTLHYPPNADGIRWFAREVFPLVRREVPQAHLTIVGKNPPADFVQLMKDEPEHVMVTGYVPELEPYYENSRLVVIPVRAGSGMRVRILEAFALGMPVVTTTVGLEGIDATPGEHVLVEDTAPGFASAVVKLLKDKGLADQLAERGRRLAESRYDWQVALDQLDEELDRIR
jgi:glycosyltransferase involved in cell wall biosynthesis